MGNQEMEAAAAAVQKTPNRVTLELIQSKIANEEYIESDGNVLTICVLTLENGFTVTGQSACADPANYNQALGRQIAKEKAVQQIWPLEGYLLREDLFRQEHERTLCQYLSDAVINDGVIDHALRAHVREDGAVEFYIHPNDRDGETADFIAKGATVREDASKRPSA